MTSPSILLHRLYLLLGANQGDCSGTFARATALLTRKVGEVIGQSAHYQTDAWGVKDQPVYLNQVLLLTTHLAPQAVLTQTQAIEQQLGRVRAEKWGSRLIDIDLLFFDDLILITPTLTIPHPLLPQRRFVLEPLAELAPALVHPVLGQTVGTLLAHCPDPGSVIKLAVADR